MADSANVLHIKLYWPEFFLGRALQWFEEICSYAMYIQYLVPCKTPSHPKGLCRTTATPRDWRKMGRAFEKMGKR